MKFNTPGQIEFFFRKELGDINPYMCLVDSAVKEIKNIIYKQKIVTKRYI